MKTIKGIFLAAVILGLLAGCGQNTKLADSFEEQKVLEEAKKVVDLVNSKDYKDFAAMCSTAMKEAVTEESFTAICEDVASKGSFESIDKTAVAGSKDKDTEQQYAVAVLIAKYSGNKVQFTISFNESMELAGFYYK